MLRSRLAATATGRELTPQAIHIACTLRSAGIRVRMDASERKLRKSLASTATKGTRFVILLDAEEAANGQLRLKDMQEKTESLMCVEDVIRMLQGITKAHACAGA
jgi:histidyl-tRNA synthetase